MKIELHSLVLGLVSGSVECRQAKELRLKLLHAPESQCGLLGKAGVQVGIRNHHHLHPCSQGRLHAIGSIFKHQALSNDRKEKTILLSSCKPIRSTGFHPFRCCRAETKNKHGKMKSRSTISIFWSDEIDIPQSNIVFLCHLKYAFNLQF